MEVCRSIVAVFATDKALFDVESVTGSNAAEYKPIWAQFAGIKAAMFGFPRSGVYEISQLECTSPDISVIVRSAM